MNEGFAAKTGGLISIIVAGFVVASCATSPPSSGNNTVGNLADVESTKDSSRIVCKSYKPASSQREERICMTAGQWAKKDAATE